MPDTASAVSPKVILLCVLNFVLWYPHLSSLQHHRIYHNWFHQLGLMRVFPRCLISGLFSIANLYELPRVTCSSSGSKTFTTEIKSHALSRKSFEILFGSLYSEILQFSLGVLFRDQSWKRLEP